MSTPISDLKDLKLLKIVNSVTEIAIAETRNLRWTMPDNVLVIIEAMFFISELANNTLNTLKIDGVDMLRTTTNIGVTKLIYNGIAHAVGTIGTSGIRASEFPCRREILANVTNTNAAANDLTAEFWAYIHNDRLQEYNQEAVATTIQPTT